MPNDQEAEQSVVGAMMMDRDAIEKASEYLTGEDFYNRQLGVIFDTIVEMDRAGIGVDDVTLPDRLREKGVPPEMSDRSYISGLILKLPTAANVKSYAQIVAEKSTLRKLIRICQETENRCFADNTDLQIVLNETEKSVFQVTQKNNSSDYEPTSAIVMRTIRKIEAACKTSGNVTGIATGFNLLDYDTAGFQPSDLILLAARPSMGKTALALNIAEYMAFRQHRTVAIFSLEMSKEQLMNRLLSMESHVEAQKLRSGDLNDRDWKELTNSANSVAGSNLIIDDTPGITVQEMRSKCRKYKMEHNLEIIFIDYLQLMSGGGRSDSRQQEVAEISRSLKALARELNVPVVALSQLSRAVESRPDKRPMMSDLRESGAIEQDADVVMFIYRDDYYNKDSDKKGIAEVIIAKQRNGPLGTVELAWLPQFTKFENPASERDAAMARANA